MYKRIAGAIDQETLDELKIEMIDRCGLLPDPLSNLFRTTAIKLNASRLGIDRIDVGPAGGRLEFRTDTAVDPFTVVKLVQAEPNTYRFREADERGRLLVTRRTDEAEERFAFVERLVARLASANTTEATGRAHGVRRATPVGERRRA